MKKVIHDLKVVKNKQLNENHFILELKASEPLPEILPGQFVEVLVDNSKSTFLRRPISIHDVDYNENTISLYIKNVGEGTNQLSYAEVDDYINVVYPLGNGFSPANSDKILLIGGGCGVAPLLYLAKSIFEKGITPTILIGGRSKNDILELEQYQKYGNVLITTEDGSFCEKGFVTNHPVLESTSFTKIYTCGPEPMMKSVGRYATSKGIECEVSLENMMACGIGACLCCVTPTQEGNKCVCTEGPVFNIKELKW